MSPSSSVVASSTCVMTASLSKSIYKFHIRAAKGVFDAVGSTELQDAGKAGLFTVHGKISAVLGTVLVCVYLFITFFPDQAEKLLQLAPTG